MKKVLNKIGFFFAYISIAIVCFFIDIFDFARENFLTFLLIILHVVLMILNLLNIIYNIYLLTNAT